MFRHLAALLTALALALAAPSPAHADGRDALAERVAVFSLELSLTATEHGDDSHTHRFVVHIDGRDVAYSGPLGEGTRGKYAHGEATFALDDEAIGRLLELLDEEALVGDFSERSASRGPGDEITLAMQVTDQGRSAALSIEGMTSVLSDNAARLSDDAARRAKALLRLCTALKRLADASLAD